VIVEAPVVRACLHLEVAVEEVSPVVVVAVADVAVVEGK